MEHRSCSIVRRFYEDVVNRGDLDAIDAIVDAAWVNHGPFPWGIRDIDGLKRFLLVREIGFPDLRVTIDELIGHEDLAAVRTTVRGIDSGQFLGLEPTGRSFEVSAIGFARVLSGRIVETWSLIDELGLLQQLGVDVQAIGAHLEPVRLAAAAGA